MPVMPRRDVLRSGDLEMSTISHESADAMRAATRKVTTEAWGKGNLAVVDEVMAPSFVSHAAMGDVEGIDGYKALIRETHEWFSDVDVEVHQILVDGDTVACRYTMTGRHTGEMQGIAPTNREVRMEGTAFARFEDGECVEEWPAGDVFALFSQIGQFPEIPGRGANAA
jgi:predicted ester cyclase